MILINLESLSTSELRNIAEQEGIQDLNEMDREDIILALVEKYEEDETPSLGDKEGSVQVTSKYVNSFSDYKSISDSVSELPGVEELPEVYEETSIHLLTKNSDWGYAFWSVSTLDKEKFQENKGELILTVAMGMKDGSRTNYDIEISDEDTEWNIGFTSAAVSCYVSLVVVYPDGKRESVAVSNTVALSSSYWHDHRDEMKENDELMKVYLTLLTTKQGEIIGNSLVRDIINAYREEDVL